ncbi:MAG: MoaD/ThiS family protein [Deltaproteobacteria bacterium]|jgi:molybdopterin converting factor small subunit|nr:MoaD/ThiS family protein [Deltaproteobacteria bacterium]MBT4088430.1 MoaD/ThiS family protein [Deltaproteobacteria bacterium]MBT4262658.1 MoaD/ThiS family protein [Deltaproteobacteria bacterium]MBT4643203.1 MoaD/ThiS family protein [Deltaproteobacteria bacterium]MBT6502734.1 MoaD/ThiS family protein [Deltaproteobacteria bacterium]
MIDIKVTFLSYIKFETGLDEVQVSLEENSTIQDLVKNLQSTYGDRLIRFMINKESGNYVSLFMKDNQICDPAEKLNHQDSIIIMPVGAGG